MDGRGNAAEALTRYITVLLENYKSLIKILSLESVDIAGSDGDSLQLHARLETETVNTIITLTKTIRSYLEKTDPDESGIEMLKQIEDLKKASAEASDHNIKALNSSMAGIKIKLQAIKLPHSARKVYYAGNNPILMDIEI